MKKWHASVYWLLVFAKKPSSFALRSKNMQMYQITDYDSKKENYSEFLTNITKNIDKNYTEYISNQKHIIGLIEKRTAHTHKQLKIASFEIINLQRHKFINHLPKKLEQKIYIDELKPYIVGLKNLGNTCYLNTALKCIAACYPFSNYIHNTQCKHTDIKLKNFHSSLIKLLPSMFSNNERTHLDISGFKESLGVLDATYSGHNQSDCYQAIITILDKTHCSLLNKNSNTLYQTKQINNIEGNMMLNPTIHNYLIDNITKVCDNSTYVYDVFLSINLLKYTCPNCIPSKGFKIKLEILNGIPLDISNQTSLDGCIKQFYDSENYSDYHCSECDKKVEIKVERHLLFLPPILIFQLKRLKCEGKGIIKDNTFIKYPFETPLNVLPFISDDVRKAYYPNVKDINYCIIAVGVHIGDLKFGHYYAYIKNQGKNRWEKHNDDVIWEESSKDILDSNAITLVYMKKDSYSLKDPIPLNRVKELLEFIKNQ